MLTATLLLAVLVSRSAVAADYESARELLESGKYERCIEAAATAIDEGTRNTAWWELKIEAELARGKYNQARETLERALRQDDTSIRLRLLGERVYRFSDQPQKSRVLLQDIELAVRRTPWRYSDPANRVALGRYFLARGADPRLVLENFYDRVRSERPDFAEVFVASGELALEKHDNQLAAEMLEKAAELAPKRPDVLYLLARAYRPSDGAKAAQFLNRALQRNPHHAPSLLLQVDQLVDEEQYEEAERTIAEILKTNPKEPEAWAYRAVLAHFANKDEDERRYRQEALSTWSTNPQVDHVIGRKLSQHYRFREGAEYQRQALAMDGTFLPAKMQLAHDLLRLGDEQGWKLAHEVYENDGYNVVAHNLVTLHELLEKFRTLTSEHFIVRMEAREAQLYGDRVLELLEQARQKLCDTYEVTLDGPVVVEIFPEQKDFAIRTFGLPGGAGFLGVCFGRVITANSPASQGANPSNWQAVLWHEFCHVVTLQKTHNKMPRWLSEGISVYEERQQDPSWGQSMTPLYREMILEDQATPVSDLSAAFLKPPTPVHLQFAYYESSLVVEYLIEKYGLETLRRILTDLGVGMPINEALERHTGSLAALDREFADYVRNRAEEWGASADWKRPKNTGPQSAEQWEAWVADHPRNFWGHQNWAKALIAAKKWDEALEVISRLQELAPDYYDSDSPYQLLAEVHRGRGDAQAEREALERLAERDSEATAAYLRLMQLCREQQDWEGVARNARRHLAVNPLVPEPHRQLAEAALHLGQTEDALRSLEAVLVLNPIDPAETHFRLAQLYHQAGQPERARRHVLEALELAPRYREAHRLLLELVEPAGRPAESASVDARGEPSPAPGNES